MIGRILYRILLFLNILMVLGTLMAYLAAFINPLSLPFLSVFNLAFPYFIVINILFVLFWAILRKYVFIISLLALLIGLKMLVNNYQFLPNSAVITKDKPTLKVLSYNVHVFDLYHWSKKLETRDSIFRFLRSEKPDVACFQEYYDAKHLYFPVHDSLIRNQSFKYSHVYYTDKLGDFQRFGIATYSAYPIVNKGIVQFPNSSNVAIYSDIVLQTDTVRVFNCHLESIRFLPEDYNFIDSIVYARKEKQIKGAEGVYLRLVNAFKKRALQTQLLNKQINKSPYPILLCGDFNDPPSSYSYRQLSKSLSDSFVEQGRGKGATFSRNIFSYRIDYILFSSEINCIEFEVPKVKYSDHFPVVGRYQLK